MRAVKRPDLDKAGFHFSEPSPKSSDQLNLAELRGLGLFLESHFMQSHLRAPRASLRRQLWGPRAPPSRDPGFVLNLPSDPIKKQRRLVFVYSRCL